MNRYDKQMLGEVGVHYRTTSGDPGLVDFVGWKITVLAPTQFDDLGNTLSGATTLPGALEVPAGTELYGEFVGTTIFSGAIAIYKSEKL
jgi:hypothetical protein